PRAAFLLARYRALPHLPSFPTRRSSDLVLAVKPQMMADALGELPVLKDTLVVSVAAGTMISTFEGAFPGAAIVRVMPNTPAAIGDRKSTRLNSSHVKISYAVFCLKKKNT